MFGPDDAPDPEQFYRKYLETWRRAGIEPVARERAVAFVQEWTEVLTGRPEPTQH